MLRVAACCCVLTEVSEVPPPSTCWVGQADESSHDNTQCMTHQLTAQAPGGVLTNREH